jgi:hypothetical protein
MIFVREHASIPIDKVTHPREKLLKETSWIYHWDTLSPNGMNSKVLFLCLSFAKKYFVYVFVSFSGILLKTSVSFVF